MGDQKTIINKYIISEVKKIKYLYADDKCSNDLRKETFDEIAERVRYTFNENMSGIPTLILPVILSTV